MATYFFDSSALVKRYHPEDGSGQIGALFVEPERRIIISHLTVVEMRSMFAGKVRMGVLTPAQANELVEHFKAEVGARRIRGTRREARTLQLEQAPLVDARAGARGPAKTIK